MAYKLAKQNNGAPGIDGVTFEAIEQDGLGGFLQQIRQELINCSYNPTGCFFYRQLGISYKWLDRY